jgi:hypothetical protein
MSADPIEKALNTMISAKVDWAQLSEEQKKHLNDLFANFSIQEMFLKLEQVFPGTSQKQTRTAIGKIIAVPASSKNITPKKSSSSAAAAAKP